MAHVKLIVYVPISQAANIRKVLSEAGAGKTGNYDSCSFSSVGTGRFRPQVAANPTIGTIGQLVSVEEERIETICSEELVKEVIAKVKAVHPYEEPAIDVIPLLNDQYLG